MPPAAPASDAATASVTEQARRFMLAALDDALVCLATPAPASDEVVHRLRKALKRARAALRLLRPLIAPRARETAVLALRDVARAYATARDGASLVEALNRFARHHPGILVARAGSTLGGALRAGRLHARRSLPDATRTAAALRMLRALRSRVAHWKLDTVSRGEDPASPSADRIAQSLRKIYRRARRAGRRAGNGATEALHAWRKEVKVLHNALLALESTAGAPGPAQLPKHSARLGEILGCEHDLAMLEIAIGALGRAPSASETRLILVQINRDRQRYRGRALREGERVFHIRPRRLAHELGIARADSASEEKTRPLRA